MLTALQETALKAVISREMNFILLNPQEKFCFSLNVIILLYFCTKSYLKLPSCSLLSFTNTWSNYWNEPGQQCWLTGYLPGPHAMDQI